MSTKHTSGAGYLLMVIVIIAALLAGLTAMNTTGATQGLPSGNIEASRDGTTAVEPQGTGGDTLIAPPYLQVILDAYAPTPTRFWCITSYAKWDHFLFLRHMYETDQTARCASNTPVFVMAGECPNERIGANGVPFILVECGPGLFALHEAPDTTSTAKKLRPHVKADNSTQP